MKIKLVIRELYRSERRVAHRLNVIAARHRSDQEIHHLAHDLAQWSQNHLHELATRGHSYGLRLAVDPQTSARTAALQQFVSGVLRKRPEPGILLLADLRRLHQLVAGTSMDWELLAQAAQASKNQELLELTKRSHPETLRQMRWANAMLKELSAQALVS